MPRSTTTIRAYCERKGISVNTFYRRFSPELREKLITAFGPRTLRISPEAERELDLILAEHQATEQRLLRRLADQRLDRAQRAGRASAASPNHVSKQQKKSELA
jgi:hypothetical protein